MNQNQLVKNLDEIRNTIPTSVRLVAVTKKVDVEVMKWVYEQGIKDFGENKLQEAINKQAQLQDLNDITWHFIGHLQSNKAKKAVESFAWIHSVDSLKIAQRLDFYAQQALNEKVIIKKNLKCAYKLSRYLMIINMVGPQNNCGMIYLYCKSYIILVLEV